MRGGGVSHSLWYSALDCANLKFRFLSFSFSFSLPFFSFDFFCFLFAYFPPRLRDFALLSCIFDSCPFLCPPTKKKKFKKQNRPPGRQKKVVPAGVGQVFLCLRFFFLRACVRASVFCVLCFGKPHGDQKKNLKIK